jgi:hypothetical protein
MITAPLTTTKCDDDLPAFVFTSRSIRDAGVRVASLHGLSPLSASLSRANEPAPEVAGEMSEVASKKVNVRCAFSPP